MKRRLAPLILLLLAGWAHADEPTARLRLDVGPREITIGDPVECKLTVQFSSSLVAMPLTPPATGEIELLAYAPPVAKQLPSGELEMVHRVILTTFSTGTLALPPFILHFQTPDGKQAEATTAPVEIKVLSVLEKAGDEGNLRPLKGLFNFRSYFWVWFALISAAILFGLYFLIQYLKTNRRGPAVKLGPPKPPEEIAWKELLDLESSGLLAEGNVKEYYSRLSAILRNYLENRYQISCMDKTTSELLVEFRKLELSLDMTTLLRAFFESGDLVKFAKLTPTEKEIGDDLQHVKQFISVTTPQKAPEPEKIPV